MAEKYLMALDQGTSSSRCIIFNKKGEIVSIAQKEFTQIYKNGGWVEHDAMEIWDTQLLVAREALERAELSPAEIAAIGITNQRETTVVWDKNTGKPLYNAIVWQCRRTADFCNSLIEKGYSDMFREKTGLLIDSYFSATKLKWILDEVDPNREKALAGDLLFGTIDAWLIWKLTNGRVHATDYSNAARTMMFNIHTLEWDKDILELLNIPEIMLPKVKMSSGIFGYTYDGLFGMPLPISGVAGDQQAALFGQNCFEKGQVKNTYGTGCFMLMNTGREPIDSKNALLTTIAWGLNGEITYALEGSVFVAGALIQWLRDELGLIEKASQSQELAESVDSTNGVYIVPAFTGLGAPYWNSDVRGTISGLTRGTNKAHIVRAALEAIAYQSRELLVLMEQESGESLSSLRVDGGASANDFLMKFQADIIDLKVERPACVETTALGAAYLAGLAVGFYKDKDDLLENIKSFDTFEPSMGIDERDKLIEGWNKAINRTLM